jgi:hypothetical protein
LTDDRAIQAAQNNADLYALVFQSHGLRFDRRAYAFVGRDQPPPYYSNLTTLCPDRSSDILDTLRQLSERFGGKIGFKDSFSRIDFSKFGFQLLFEASWIWGDQAPAQMPPGWDIVQKEADLAAWEESWKAHGSPTEVQMFKPSLLSEPDIAFLGKRDASGPYTSGAIVNRSADCAGLSNVFAQTPNAKTLAEASAAAGAVFGDLPLAGYERGKELEFALACGFEPVGDLRIAKATRAFL